MKKKYDEYLFIDGYNIINAWSDLKELKKISLEAARDKLIEIMGEYQEYAGVKVIIVFDAHLVKGSINKKEIINGIEVVFTKEMETADHYIEKVLDSIGRMKRVKVATSDWTEQQIVLGRGGMRISARELKEEVNKMKRKIQKDTEQNKKRVDDLIFSRLDSETLKKLEKWRKNI
ncbi:NYN domain-containing protein [Caloranaerobacter sp. DY30410]|uniref:NYN domain-containing protein n=1 Tax=Caloranaerobacter sp. DY30410 TaxID=3238305 RepID=UPI003CFD48A8